MGNWAFISDGGKMRATSSIETITDSFSEPDQDPDEGLELPYRVTIRFRDGATMIFEGEDAARLRAWYGPLTFERVEPRQVPMTRRNQSPASSVASPEPMSDAEVEELSSLVPPGSQLERDIDLVYGTKPPSGDDHGGGSG